MNQIARTLVALLAAAPLTLLTACGDGGSTSNSATPSSSGPKASGSNKPTASAATSAKTAPKGPTFKAKVMGMDQEKPLVEISLEKAEMKGLTIVAPEGAEVRVGKPGGGAEVVSAGVNYSMSIREDEFKQKNAHIVFDAVDDKGKYLLDTEELVIFQREKGSVLFGMGVTVGGKKYHCGTVATGFDFDRSTVDQMVESCKTLKSSGAAPATSASASPSAAPSASAAPK